MQTNAQVYADELKALRLHELHTLFSKYDQTLANEVLPNRRPIGESKQQSLALDRDETAAVVLQKYIRGFLARKRYVDLLYERYLESERERDRWTQVQVEEGLYLMQKTQMDEEVRMRKSKIANDSARTYYGAFIIQRWWRKRLLLKKAKHISRPVEDSDALFSRTTTSIASIKSRWSSKQKLTREDCIQLDSIMTEDRLMELLMTDESRLQETELDEMECVLRLLLDYKSVKLDQAKEQQKALAEEHDVLDQMIHNLIRKLV